MKELAMDGFGKRGEGLLSMIMSFIHGKVDRQGGSAEDYY